MGQQAQLALAGAIPAILAMLFFDWLDRKRPEPRRTLRRVAIAGMLSVIPVLIVAVPLHVYGPAKDTVFGAVWESFLVAAGPEEAAKIGVLWLFVWRRPEFDEHMDGITYGARAGLGFALVENVAYLWTVPPEGYLQMFIGRAVLAVPGHAMWGAMAGYFAARRRFEGEGPGLLGGYLLAFFLHGIYDVALFLVPVVSARAVEGSPEQALAVGLLLVPVIVIAGGGLAIAAMVRAAVAADDRLEARGHLVGYLPPS